MKFYRIISLFLICWLTLFATAGVSAKRHRFHTTLTRIDYNAGEKNFEIIIKLFTHDLMPLLEKRGGKRLDLEKSPEADKLILEYINENFVLSDKKDTAKTLKWVGKDFDIDEVRVYLETDSTETLEGYKLKNTLFFADFSEQINIVVCRYDGKKADLLYKAGDKIKQIVANKPTTEN
jgi:hypothetical protein